MLVVPCYPGECPRGVVFGGGGGESHNEKENAELDPLGVFP